MIRLLGVLVLIAAGIYAWIWWGDRQEEEARKEYLRYAHVIAETQIAAELNRYQPDSFYVARDSILNRHGLTLAEMKNFENQYKGDERRWSHLWFYVDSLVDSMVTFYDSVYLEDTLGNLFVFPVDSADSSK